MNQPKDLRRTKTKTALCPAQIFGCFFAVGLNAEKMLRRILSFALSSIRWRRANPFSRGPAKPKGIRFATGLMRTALTLPLCFPVLLSAAEIIETDIFIYGGTAGGVAAAVQAIGRASCRERV